MSIMSNDLHKIIKSHFNIQNNPFFHVYNRYSTDSINNIVDKSISKPKQEESHQFDDIENEEYLDITSSDIYHIEQTPEETHNTIIQEQYLGEMLLNHTHLKLKSNTPVSIIIYRINHVRNKPFLEFCLYKTPNTGVLHLPSINWLSNKTPEELRVNLTRTFKHYSRDITYKGFYMDNDRNNKPYLCYKVLANTNIIPQHSNTNSWVWVTVDEIINQRKTYDLTIDKNVSTFFINNEYFAYLEDVQGNIVEVPTVAYYGSEHTYINVALSIGLLKQEMEEIYGPYYYFYSYDKALQDAKDELIKKQQKCGIIRYVLFMGNTYVKLRKHKSTAISEALVHYDSFIEPSKYLRTNNYNLIYYHPTYVVKQKTQYFPLSYLII